MCPKRSFLCFTAEQPLDHLKTCSQACNVFMFSVNCYSRGISPQHAVQIVLVQSHMLNLNACEIETV